MGRRRCGPQFVYFARAGVLHPFIEYFERIGCPTWEVLSLAHLSPALLADPGTPVPVRSIYRFLQEAGHASGIDHPGLRVGMSLDPSATFGCRLRGPTTLLRTLQRACRLIPTISTSSRCWMEPAGNEVRFCHSESAVEQALQGHLFVLGLAIGLIRAVATRCWVPSEIRLPVERAPQLTGLSDAFLHVRVDVRRPYASFTVPSGFLSLPMPGSDRRKGRNRRPGSTAPLPFEFVESMRRLAECQALDGRSDLPTLAEISGTSARTLQRRLAECGTSLSALMIEARMKLSGRWLRDTARPITEIAHALGYADSANFTRAFRRSAGLPPRTYRSGIGRDKSSSDRPVSPIIDSVREDRAPIAGRHYP